MESGVCAWDTFGAMNEKKNGDVGRNRCGCIVLVVPCISWQQRPY
jgi:hypothetical protein